MKYKLVLRSMVFTLLASLVITSCAAPTPAPAPAPSPMPAPAPTPAPTPEQITIKVVTYRPLDNETLGGFNMFMERVNERANEELIIEWVGGPEAIGARDQGIAVQTGVADMSVLPASFYPGLVQAAEMGKLSRISPQEMRERGVYDYLLEQHKEVGLYYLGRGAHSYGGWFRIFTNKKTETPYDLVGQRIGRGSTAESLSRTLGIIPIRIPLGDVYTALERGMLDGSVHPLVGFTSYSWQEATKYMIDHAFFISNIVFIMNLDTWSRVPENLQNLMTEVAIEVEQDYPSIVAESEAREWQVMQEAGVEAITFSPADAEWYIEACYRGEWEKYMEKSPEVASIMKEMLSE